MELDIGIGGYIDFWIYQTEDLQRYIEHGEQIYDSPAHESIKDGVEMTAEIFDELWATIFETDT